MLKGAALFVLWSDQPHRATRDVDLLGSGDNSIPHMEEVFRRLCEVHVEDDGLVFLSDTVHGRVISADEEYEGLRLTLTAMLGKATIPIQVDIGFGDVVTPAPEIVEYPVLLALPAPKLPAYPRETVVAEKLQAMVEFGMGNSRMKDFFDLWVIGCQFEFDGELLARAIRATFERRKTALPAQPPLALTDTFSADSDKQTQWRAFMRRIQPRSAAVPAGLEEICTFLAGFLMPPMQSPAGTSKMIWLAGGPWTDQEE